MKLDKNLKYEFRGDVYTWVTSWDDGEKEELWESPVHNFCDETFEFLASKGLVEEHAEPIANIVVKAQVCLHPGEMWSLTEPPIAAMIALGVNDGPQPRTLNIEITEISFD